MFENDGITLRLYISWKGDPTLEISQLGHLSLDDPEELEFDLGHASSDDPLDVPKPYTEDIRAIGDKLLSDPRGVDGSLSQS